MLKFNPANKSLFFKAIIFASILTIIDLYSKVAIFNYLDNLEYPFIRISNFLNIVKVYNTGISFGMFNDLAYGKYILIIIALIISIFLIMWLYKTNDKLIIFALSLIIAGAFGNIIDRAINGAVADFIDVHLGAYHWPAFNFADSYITIGAILLIYDEFFRKGKTKNA
ncbi:MAG: signal peptidase II [Rickettsiales bacterium]|nr:signal peptidase II [Rickettsiales bacterium]